MVVCAMGFSKAMRAIDVEILFEIWWCWCSMPARHSTKLVPCLTSAMESSMSFLTASE